MILSLYKTHTLPKHVTGYDVMLSPYCVQRSFRTQPIIGGITHFFMSVGILVQPLDLGLKPCQFCPSRRVCVRKYTL